MISEPIAERTREVDQRHKGLRALHDQRTARVGAPIRPRTQSTGNRQGPPTPCRLESRCVRGRRQPERGRQGPIRRFPYSMREEGSQWSSLPQSCDTQSSQRSLKSDFTRDEARNKEESSDGERRRQDRLKELLSSWRLKDSELHGQGLGSKGEDGAAQMEKLRKKRS